MSHPSAGGRANVGPEDPTPSVGEPSSEALLSVDGELAPGTMVGEFRVEARLGAGGMSTVYSAIQPLIGKRAAIKVIARHLCMDPINVDRFVQEARAANQIGHPNIVDAFAFGVLPDGRSYLIMEWLQGETLAERLRQGQMSVPDALAILFQMCDGLAATHEKGIVHRDLKPENVFLVPVRNRRLLVKLLDFGVAKLRGFRGEPTVGHTSPGATVGTPKYMAPEQARGKEVDYRADVYSLGVTAYEMFTGRVPFIGMDAIDVMHKHVYDMPPAPSSLRPDLPVQIERLLLQMLEKRPDKRPTLMQVEARLADVRDALAVKTPPPTPNDLDSTAAGKRWPTAPRRHEPTDVLGALQSRRRRQLLWLAAPLALLVAGGTLWGVLHALGGARPSAPAQATTETSAPAPTSATPPAVPEATTPLTAAAMAPARPATTPSPAPAAADAPATLVVTVNAPGARIELDGQLVGSGGRAARVRVARAGAHRLVVGAPHYRTLHRDVTVRAGADERVDVTLDPSAPGPSAPPPSPRRPHNRDDMLDPFAR